ncbi:hypothetical protein FW784_13570, partial [Lysobacter lacus]
MSDQIPDAGEVAEKRVRKTRVSKADPTAVTAAETAPRNEPAPSPSTEVPARTETAPRADQAQTSESAPRSEQPPRHERPHNPEAAPASGAPQPSSAGE